MDCLSPTNIESLHQGTAPSDSVFVWRNHVASCENCSAALEKLATSVASETVFSRYVVVAEIGRGASGKVFRAVDPTLERTVALKVLRDELRSNEENVRLLEEARTLAKLSHPNVATIFDAGETPGGVFLAMEFLSGETLETWLQSKRSHKEILKVLIEAGRGLEAAHQSKIIHRDFKPANVVLHNGHAKVTDFGLASTAKSDQKNRTSSSGTPRFMAPEHKLGFSSEKSDQFSFSICLQLALEKNGPIPKWISLILARGTAENVARRFDSMSSLLTALEKDPAIIRRRYVAFGAVVLSVAIGLAGVVQSQRKLQHSCDDAGSKAARVISVKRLDAIENILGALQSKDNELSGVNQLIKWKLIWQNLAQNGCTETKINGVQSGALFDLKQLCLERKLVFVDAILETIDEKTSVNKLAEALADLPNLNECSDEKTLVTQSESETPAQREKARPVREMLERVQSYAVLGMTREARTLLDKVVDLAKPLNIDSLDSECLVLLGQYQLNAGNTKIGQETIVQAYIKSSKANHNVVAMRASLALLATAGVTPESLFLAATFSEGALARIGFDENWQGAQNYFLGKAEFEAGRYNDAVSHLEAGLRLREKILGPNNLRTQETKRVYGILLENVGRFSEAVELYKEVYSIDVKLFGKQSIPAARSLGVLGSGLCAIGKPLEAEPLLVSAQQIHETDVENEVENLFNVLDSLAQVQEKKRDWKSALVTRNRIEKFIGGIDYLREINRGCLSRVLLEMGKIDEAKTMAHSAIDFASKADPKHPDLVVPLLTLARIELKEFGQTSIVARLSELPLPTNQEVYGDLKFVEALTTKNKTLRQNIAEESKNAFLRAGSQPRSDNK